MRLPLIYRRTGGAAMDGGSRSASRITSVRAGSGQQRATSIRARGPVQVHDCRPSVSGGYVPLSQVTLDGTSAALERLTGTPPIT